MKSTYNLEQLQPSAGFKGLVLLLRLSLLGSQVLENNIARRGLQVDIKNEWTILALKQVKPINKSSFKRTIAGGVLCGR
jgi:hypothetical protein